MTPDRIGFYERIQSKDKTIEIPLYREMAEYCFEKKLMCFDDSTSLRFDGKKWDWISKNYLVSFIMEENQECIKPAHIDNFAKMIKGKCHIGKITTKPSDGLINVNNGIINVASGELMPHSHEYLFKYCSPVDFDPKAECPSWTKFLDDTFEKNQELKDLAQRLFGYLLIGGRPFLHKAFVLYGTGRNGKSTFLDVLRAALGNESYSTVSMAKIDKEFSIVTMEGKLANIVEETPTDEINAEAFKNLVGGGETTAAYKGMNEFKFRCNARFVFACNEMPVFKDKSVGLEERLVFIPFARYLKEEDRDESITERLLAEMPGILNWSLTGAKLMQTDKKLPKYEVTKESKELYKRETNALYAWFCEELEIDTKAPSIAVKDVYDAYKKDSEENGNKPFSKINFSRNLRPIIRQKYEELRISYNNNAKSHDGDARIFEFLKLKRHRKEQTDLTKDSVDLSLKKRRYNGGLDNVDG